MPFTKLHDRMMQDFIPADRDTARSLADQAALFPFYNVTDPDYGADPTGASDSAAAIQAAWDKAFVAGGTVYFPPGKFKVASKVHCDVRGVTGAPSSNRRRVNFLGAGKGNTVIAAATDSQIAIHVQGDNPLTSGSHAYITISGLAFVGDTPTSRTATGLKLEDLAYLTVSETTFHNLNVDLHLVGVLSSKFDGLIFNESVKGVLAEAGASGPHANSWHGCKFRQLTSIGYHGFTTMSNGTFVGCNWEGCGTHGDSAKGAVNMTMSGSAGEAGPVFIGCYFEVNKGGWDVQLSESASARVTAQFIGCNFNRTSSTAFATNNIKTAGDIDLCLMGNAFTSHNTYVPDAGRPYLNLGATTRYRDLGNRFEDATEGPTISQGLPWAGWVEGSLGASVTGTLPNNWSVSQSATGVFTVTHNLGHTDYALVATTDSASARVVERTVIQTNSFLVKITSTANAATDDDFSFMLMELKPIN